MSGLYLISPLADWLLLGGGSILVYFLCLLAPASLESFATAWGGVLICTISYPHFSATLHRLYRKPQTASLYPVAAYILPWVAVAFVFGSLAQPQTVAPALIKLYSLWSPFHYSGQNLGIALIYAHRAGRKVSRAERWGLAAMFYTFFLLITSRQEVKRGMNTFSGIAYPTFGIPSWFPWVALAFAIVAAAVFGFLMIRRTFVGKSPMPAIFYLPILCQLLWFVLSRQNSTYLGLIAYFHGLQYLPFAWFMHLKTSESSTEDERWAQTAKWGAENLVGGAVLFMLIPFFVSTFGYSFQFAQTVVGAAVNVHHFLVDGIIWKLRRPAVQKPLIEGVLLLGRSPA